MGATPLPPGARENVSLASLCTLGVGGPARYLIEAYDAEQARAAALWARTHALPLLVLGGGSNLVVSDEGFPGLVLHVKLRGLSIESVPDGVTLRIGAGEIWDEVVSRSVAGGLSGIECLSGIPGFAGATPIQNVGAYGQEIGRTLVGVEALDLRSDTIESLAVSECGLGCRTSRFKTVDRGRYLLLALTLSLSKDAAPLPESDELRRRIGDLSGRSVTPRTIRDAVIALRRSKSMILDESDPNTRSVGSFFMNPILESHVYAAIVESSRRKALLAVSEEPPHHVMTDGAVKLPAAWLIERSGFARGLVLGHVGLSPRHALAVVNRGGATTQEVLAMARAIRDAVADRFGITLTPEPELVGVAWDS